MVVETSVFTTEVILCNVSTAAATVRLSYVADAIQTADSTASISITLGAGEQKVIPSFVQYLRSQGVPGVAAPGPTFAGALYLSVTGADPAASSWEAGRRPPGGGGHYGLFYTALANGTTATSSAWLFGLQQNAENRTNLALANTGETDSTTIGLHVDLYDGVTGSIARSFDVSLAPKKWTQINTVLSPGIANGYARITRTSGTNTFLAYAVVVDGGAPQTASDDGAFVSLQVQEPQASAQLLAIRKVEAKAKSLGAQGVSRLDYVRGVADYHGHAARVHGVGRGRGDPHGVRRLRGRPAPPRDDNRDADTSSNPPFAHPAGASPRPSCRARGGRASSSRSG